MSGITGTQGVNPNNVAVSMVGGMTEEAAAVGNGATVQNLAKDIAPLLRKDSVLVTRSENVSGRSLASGEEAVAMRSLSAIFVELELDDAEMQDIAEDLEALISYLTLENDEAQAKVTKERIQSLVNTLQAKHDATVKKVNESFDAAVEQDKANKRNKIFGWITTAISVIAAAISIVVTVGAATPLAIASCTLCCAAAATGLICSSLSESGQLEEWAEDWAEDLMKEDPSLSKSKAMQKAQEKQQWIITGVTMALGIASLGCGALNMSSVGVKMAAKLGQKFAEAMLSNVYRGAKAAQQAVGLISLGTGVAGTVMAFDNAKLSRDAAKMEAAAKELQQILDLIKQRIEEEEELVQKLVEQMQGEFKVIADMLMASDDASTDILTNLGTYS